MQVPLQSSSATLHLTSAVVSLSCLPVYHCKIGKCLPTLLRSNLLIATSQPLPPESASDVV